MGVMMIICPRCKSEKIEVRRDMTSRRTCQECRMTWLPYREETVKSATIAELKENPHVQHLLETLTRVINQGWEGGWDEQAVYVQDRTKGWMK